MYLKVPAHLRQGRTVVLIIYCRARFVVNLLGLKNTEAQFLLLLSNLLLAEYISDNTPVIFFFWANAYTAAPVNWTMLPRRALACLSKHFEL